MFISKKSINTIRPLVFVNRQNINPTVINEPEKKDVKKNPKEKAEKPKASEFVAEPVSEQSPVKKEEK